MAISPAIIPEINPIFKVTNRVAKKIMSCSFPMVKIRRTTSGEASLYPVYTRIAIKAVSGILVSSELKRTINTTKNSA